MEEEKTNEELDESETDEDIKEESDDSEESDGSLEIDYSAEIEKEKQRGKPDPLKARKAFEERERRRKEKEEEDEEDKPMTRQEFEEVLAKDRFERDKDNREGRALAIAKSLTDNELEAGAMLAKWRNRVFPDDMPIEEQVEEMYAAVNRKRIMSQNSELKKALKSKEGTSKGYAGTFKEEQPIPAPKIGEQDKASLTRAGFVYDNKQKVWKKKLPNGKFLIKDLRVKDKTRQNYLA